MQYLIRSIITVMLIVSYSALTTMLLYVWISRSTELLFDVVETVLGLYMFSAAFWTVVFWWVMFRYL